MSKSRKGEIVVAKDDDRERQKSEDMKIKGDKKGR